MKPLGKGSRVVTHGNVSRRGVILGRFKECWVIKLDRPIRIRQRGGIEEISTLLVHRTNVFAEGR